MSRKHAELEREFIEDLEPRTGRSLAEWMDAINGAGLSDKNAIIDWLRPQGFTFANASWLERIHNNGGRPIYLDTATAPSPAAGASKAPPRREPVQMPPPEGVPPAAAEVGAADNDRLKEVLARAKGLRPLAEMVLRDIRATLPSAVLVPAGDRISICDPAELATLWLSPRELRLALALGEVPFEGGLVKARMPGANPLLSHMLVLTDARQVGAALVDLVRRARERKNSST